MKSLKRLALLLLVLATLLGVAACNFASDSAEISVDITGTDRITLYVGEELQLSLSEVDHADRVTWSASNSNATVNENGLVKAVSEGKVIITAALGESSDMVLIEVIRRGEHDADDKYSGISAAVFYQNYTPAESYEDACLRSLHGFMSGSLSVPDQAPTLSELRPKKNGKFIRNNVTTYSDENTYIVVDAYGEEVMKIYRGGGYITLEEVAAYLYAFGDVPANYVEGKNLSPVGNVWGKYLRLNHTPFSGDTQKYPYEPVLPNISGCGGDLYYYEIDVGTTGTDCDPKYISKTYNDGTTITRGAARIVYTRYDANRNKIIDPNEKYLFYTYNHYNDFQEYLNYYGGWGEMFGNITGGGKISSKTDYNPTPYVETEMDSLPISPEGICVYYYNEKRILAMLRANNYSQNKAA